jgi:hypothetical protein
VRTYKCVCGDLLKFGLWLGAGLKSWPAPGCVVVSPLCSVGVGVICVSYRMLGGAMVVPERRCRLQPVAA